MGDVQIAVKLPIASEDDNTYLVFQPVYQSGLVDASFEGRRGRGFQLSLDELVDAVDTLKAHMA